METRLAHIRAVDMLVSLNQLENLLQYLPLCTMTYFVNNVTQRRS